MPQRLKPDYFAPVTARLKPCPDAKQVVTQTLQPAEASVSFSLIVLDKTGLLDVCATIVGLCRQELLDYHS
jgi:hypothetical protein